VCYPASFVVTRNMSVFWSRHSDSHNEIIEEHSLHEGRNPDDPNFVCVEVRPPKEGLFQAPLEDWTFHLDDDRGGAPWVNVRNLEKAVRLKLPDWHKARVLLEGQRKHVGQFYASGDTCAYLSDSASARIYENSRLLMQDSCFVKAHGRSTCRLQDMSRGVLFDESGAYCEGLGCSVMCYRKSRVLLHNGGSSKNFHTSVAVLTNSPGRPGGRVFAAEHATVILPNGGTAYLTQPSKAVLPDGSSGIVVMDQRASVFLGPARSGLLFRDVEGEIIPVRIPEDSPKGPVRVVFFETDQVLPREVQPTILPVSEREWGDMLSFQNLVAPLRDL